jgi:arylsulfatase
MLMSGTDNHRAGLGNMIELRSPEQAGQPGYEGYLSKRVVSLPELLRDAGYETIMSGKWHLGVEPDQDPFQRGFERTFASLPAGNNHFGVTVSLAKSAQAKKITQFTYTENGKLVDALPADYYSSDYFTDKLIGFLRVNEGKRSQPFFAYLPFTAPHWPLQAPASIIDKYKGRYDGGWDVLRRERLARQQQLGVLPANAQLDAPATLADWNSLSKEQQRYAAREMEVYAAMIDRLDWNVGKLIDYLEKTGEIDNTIILFFSDNGAEGGNAAREIEKVAGVKIPKTPFAKIGSAESINSLGPHWAQAISAPRRLYKSNATEGGILVSAIISYPPSVRQGTIDRNLVTVMDVMPTLLDLAGTQHPGKQYRGRAVEPMQGVSMLPFLLGQADRVHSPDEAIGWELFGQRAIRQGDWKIAWVSKPNGSASWELYALDKDPGERHDLAGKYPEKLAAMLQHWEHYAKENRIIPHEHLVSPYNDPIE